MPENTVLGYQPGVQDLQESAFRDAPVKCQINDSKKGQHKAYELEINYHS